MLTSFFGGSKPATVIIVLIYMTALFTVAHVGFFNADQSLYNIPVILGKWLLYMLALFILNFITQKNDLTKPTAFKIVLFAAFSGAIPTALLEVEVLFSGVCMLLAMRRMISLRSGLAIDQKLFDAAFWIAIASVFYFWCVLFYGALYIAILLFAAYNVRHWLIPLIGLGAVLILYTCYVLWTENSLQLFWDFYPGISLNFKAYNALELLLPISFFIGLLLWSLVSYIKAYRFGALQQRPVFLMILYLTGIALLLIVVHPSKSGAEWYFFIPGLCIIVSNYLENASGRIFKEVFLWLLMLLPLVVLYLR